MQLAGASAMKFEGDKVLAENLDLVFNATSGSQRGGTAAGAVGVTRR